MLQIVNMCYCTGVHVEISGYCLFFMEIIKMLSQLRDYRAMYWKNIHGM